MKKSNNLSLLMGIVLAATAIFAAVTAVLVYMDKKKEEEDLEHYLDYSIQ